MVNFCAARTSLIPSFVPIFSAGTIDEVSADKAYSGVDNYQAVADAGGTGFIAYKSNATGAAGGLFEKTLCKLLCFNLTCLVHEQEKLGIVPAFWKEDGTPALCKAEPLAIRNAVAVAPAKTEIEPVEEPMPTLAAFGGTFSAGWGV